jgi:hypothetical protein
MPLPGSLLNKRTGPLKCVAGLTTFVKAAEILDLSGEAVVTLSVPHTERLGKQIQSLVYWNGGEVNLTGRAGIEVVEGLYAAASVEVPLRYIGLASEKALIEELKMYVSEGCIDGLVLVGPNGTDVNLESFTNSKPLGETLMRAASSRSLQFMQSFYKPFNGKDTAVIQEPMTKVLEDKVNEARTGFPSPDDTVTAIVAYVNLVQQMLQILKSPELQKFNNSYLAAQQAHNSVISRVEHAALELLPRPKAD